MGTSTIFSTPPNQFLIQLVSMIGKSLAGGFWQAATTLWSGYWPLVLLLLAIILIYELRTRNGRAHFNSRNGFSPDFNRLVGSGTYLLLQAVVYAFLHFLFGASVYTHVWPYGLHLVVFGLTKLLLNSTGFWVY